MALIGLIIATVVNIFLGSAPISFVISLSASSSSGPHRVRRPADLARRLRGVRRVDGEGAVIGALHLYLDFINLFLFLLRLFGSRR